jgi:hypothetical protein
MKWCSDVILDEALNYIKDGTNKLCVCSTQPTTYTEAVTTYMLANVAMTAADFDGPTDGSVSGRKLTVKEQVEMSITNSGNVQHIALVFTSGSELLYVTTCLVRSILSGNKLTVPEWNIELRDPD